MSNPLVSIIVPAYKSDRYIKRCINSVIAQTYENWELVVVVSPPGDTTVRIVCDYADPRIHVIPEFQKTNVATARNAGLVATSGKYVAFLDADDWWRPRKLEKQIRRLEIVSAMWCCHYLVIHHDDETIELNCAYPGRSMGIEGLHTILMRRSLLDVVGRFDQSMQKADDADMVLRISSYPSVCLCECLSDCYANPVGLTKNTTGFQNLMIVSRLAVKYGAWELLAYHWKNYLLAAAGFHYD